MAQSRAEGKVGPVPWMAESGENAFLVAGVYREISCYILSSVPSGCMMVPWSVTHHSSETQ